MFNARSQLVPGWSAAQGGLGASNEHRDVMSQQYLRRRCVMNPEGGPQDAAATDTHRRRASAALAQVDEMRRIEYHRKKAKAEIDDRIEKIELGNQINANLGWPFNQNLVPQKKEQAQTSTDNPEQSKVEMVERLLGKKKPGDTEVEWDRTIFGTMKLQEGEGAHQKPILGPVVWEEGYLQAQGPSVQFTVNYEEDDGMNEEFQTNLKATVFDSARTCLNSHGKDSNGLKEDDITVSLKNSANAYQIRIFVQDKVEGDIIIHEQIFSETKLQGILKKKLSVTSLPKSLGPEENPTLLDQLIWKPMSSIAPVIIEATGSKEFVEHISKGKKMSSVPEKTIQGREVEVRDIVKGGYSKIKFPDGGRFLTDVKVQATLTGSTLYETEKIKELEHKLTTEELSIQDVIKKCTADPPKMIEEHGRHKIALSQKNIEAAQRDLEKLKYRVIREDYEIKALELELEYLELGQGMPLPKQVMLALPREALEGWKSAKDKFDALFGNDKNQEPNQKTQNEWFSFFEGDQRKNVKSDDKYFGMPLIDPVSGKLDMEVVKRKNKDTVLKAKEDSKTIVDIFLGRSDGKTRFGTTPAMRAKEKQVREEQQRIVDSMLRKAIKNNPFKDVEDWAKSENRQKSVFGSSQHPVLKQKMKVVELDSGGTYKLTTLVPVRQMSSKDKYSQDSSSPTRESGDVWSSESLALLLNKNYYSANDGQTPNTVERN
ncbi:hypothetical protein GUITHDRAFT_104642 [Guillardia theta CCMP2712]|uniref:Uncharacterized protein n=1 Tax=Guillardia theta (strain CCMP2712) TaxID=905079 RepID=L1JN23_GUITC|nr:hypothetical protein GUITHDRAFT_104642 [Guillardia theta CCMP2712]EKX49679.1 hypothetical protein GUITHDRAFT_104642 [Guillardia theta CCMP2712]|eukprot:XP_005836659.1 hypothetical protein GUITHDRAFT_104642 [Guillardia theta CCMP2712]